MSLIASAGFPAKSPWQKSYAPRILRDARRSDEHIPPARSVEHGTAMAQAAVVPAGPLIDRGPLRRPDRPGLVTPVRQERTKSSLQSATPPEPTPQRNDEAWPAPHPNVRTCGTFAGATSAPRLEGPYRKATRST
jgi:hypothetical protein